MPQPLTRKILDASGCDVPDCGHDHSVLYVHGLCHPDAGSRVSYHKDTGNISVQCAECEELIVQVKVAKE